MFYLLRKAHLLQLIVGVLALLGCGVMIFIKPLDVSLLNNSLPCSMALLQWTMSHPIGTQFLALIFLLLQGAMLFHYVRTCGFLDEENALSILFFCAFLLGMGIFLPLTPAWFTNTATLAVLNLSNRAFSSNSKTPLLLAGIVLGTATLFDLAALLLLVFFILYVLIHQIDKLRDLLATLCGVLTPYLYLLAYHYFVGSLPTYLHSFSQLHLHFPLFTQTHYSLYALIAMPLGLLLTVYVMFRLKVLYSNKLIIIRRRFLLLCILFCFNLAMVLTSNVTFPLSLYYLIIPITVFTISFIPARNFAISSEILLALLTASFVVMARL